MGELIAANFVSKKVVEHQSPPDNDTYISDLDTDLLIDLGKQCCRAAGRSYQQLSKTDQSIKEDAENFKNNLGTSLAVYHELTLRGQQDTARQIFEEADSLSGLDY
jgi:hypothetical protein